MSIWRKHAGKKQVVTGTKKIPIFGFKTKVVYFDEAWSSWNLCMLGAHHNSTFMYVGNKNSCLLQVLSHNFKGSILEWSDNMWEK